MGWAFEMFLDFCCCSQFLVSFANPAVRNFSVKCWVVGVQVISLICIDKLQKEHP